MLCDQEFGAPCPVVAESIRHADSEPYVQLAVPSRASHSEASGNVLASDKSAAPQLNVLQWLWNSKSPALERPLLVLLMQQYTSQLFQPQYHSSAAPPAPGIPCAVYTDLQY